MEIRMTGRRNAMNREYCYALKYANQTIVQLFAFSAFWIEMKRNVCDLFFVSVWIYFDGIDHFQSHCDRVSIHFVIAKFYFELLLPLAFPQSHFAHRAHANLPNLLDQKY